MALSLMLRNSCKLRGLAALPRCTFQIQKTQNFTHLVKNNKNLVEKCRFQLVNIAQQSKRNMSGDHSRMWNIERVLSLILVGLVPATFIMPNKILDNLFALAIVMHFHWGLEACVIDYVRPIIVGNILPKVALFLLYVVSATTLAGLIYYNQHQIGIGATFRQFWAITGNPDPEDKKQE